MMKLLYETGCRVGEFTKIQLKHVDFNNATVYFPKDNTKTKRSRTSNIPDSLAEELKDFICTTEGLKVRQDTFKNTDSYLFSSYSDSPYSTNRIRQIFQRYIVLSGLDREYGTDSLGRSLHTFTVHSLRHSHIMHYIHHYKIKLFIS